MLAHKVPNEDEGSSSACSSKSPRRYDSGELAARWAETAVQAAARGKLLGQLHSAPAAPTTSEPKESVTPQQQDTDKISVISWIVSNEPHAAPIPQPSPKPQSPFITPGRQDHDTRQSPTPRKYALSKRRHHRAAMTREISVTDDEAVEPDTLEWLAYCRRESVGPGRVSDARPPPLSPIRDHQPRPATSIPFQTGGHHRRHSTISRGTSQLIFHRPKRRSPPPDVYAQPQSQGSRSNRHNYPTSPSSPGTLNEPETERLILRLVNRLDRRHQASLTASGTPGTHRRGDRSSGTTTHRRSTAGDRYDAPVFCRTHTSDCPSDGAHPVAPSSSGFSDVVKKTESGRRHFSAHDHYQHNRPPTPNKAHLTPEIEQFIMGLIHQSDKELSRLVKENKELKARLEGAAHDAASEVDLHEARSRIAELSLEVSHMSSAIHRLRIDLSAVESEKAEVEATMQKRLAEGAAKQSDLLQRLVAAEDKGTYFDERLASLKAQHSQLLSDVEAKHQLALQQARDLLNETRGEADSAQHKLKSEIQSLRLEVDGEKRRNTALEATLQENLLELQKHRIKAEEAASSARRSKRHYEELKRSKEYTADASQEQARQVEDLRVQLQTANLEKERLEHQAEEGAKETCTLRSLLQERQVTCSVCERMIEEQKSYIGTMRNKHEALHNENRELRNEVQQLKAQINKLNEDINKLKCQVPPPQNSDLWRRLKTENEELRRELKEKLQSFDLVLRKLDDLEEDQQKENREKDSLHQNQLEMAQTKYNQQIQQLRTNYNCELQALRQLSETMKQNNESLSALLARKEEELTRAHFELDTVKESTQHQLAQAVDALTKSLCPRISVTGNQEGQLTTENKITGLVNQHHLVSTTHQSESCFPKTTTSSSSNCASPFESASN